jgi:TonB family protein
LFSILAAAASAQLAPATIGSPSIPEQQWPTAVAGRILSTPDWSDYRIYPAASLRKEQEGRVVPEMLIGIDGKPEACRILVSSKFKELDAGSCGLMMQMRFEPALDLTGNPVASHYSRALVWGLTDPRPFASSTLTARVRIADGSLEQCEVVGGEGQYVAFWSAVACNFFGDTDYYFGDRSKDSLSAIIDVRLDASDNSPFLEKPWRSGPIIAGEKVTFAINNSGDASSCVPVESHGFGRRGMNNLSPCGRLLSVLWFKNPRKGNTARNGVFETRVVQIGSEEQP